MQSGIKKRHNNRGHVSCSAVAVVLLPTIAGTAGLDWTEREIRARRALPWKERTVLAGGDYRRSEAQVRLRNKRLSVFVVDIGEVLYPLLSNVRNNGENTLAYKRTRRTIANA